MKEPTKYIDIGDKVPLKSYRNGQEGQENDFAYRKIGSMTYLIERSHCELKRYINQLRKRHVQDQEEILMEVFCEIFDVLVPKVIESYRTNMRKGRRPNTLRQYSKVQEWLYGK